MMKDVRNYVLSCHTCNAQKVDNMSRLGFTRKPKQVSSPWQFVSVDLLGPFQRLRKGHCYLLAISDKLFILRSMKKAVTHTIIKILIEEFFSVLWISATNTL